MTSVFNQLLLSQLNSKLPRFIFRHFKYVILLIIEFCLDICIKSNERKKTTLENGDDNNNNNQIQMCLHVIS